MAETLVIALRAASLLAFAAPMLLVVRRRRRAPDSRARQGRGGRVPVVANLTAFALFVPILLTFPGTIMGYAVLLLALTGCILAAAGAAVVLRSRMELGPAWSLAPIASEASGLVMTGPYRLVRHPIYLGFSTLALGQALAFANWPAVLVLLAGIIPTFVWRAAAEEKVLTATFGERYSRYKAQTKMIIPCLL
jgi:protein-S-isoprenylcysteine O-methyltransferase Ste14